MVSDFSDLSYAERLEMLEQTQAKLDRLQIACYGLLNYCHRNILNFQREKLDDYLRNIEQIMEENQK